MPGYIPSSDAEKLIWLANFNTWTGAKGVTHGLSPADVAQLDTETGNSNIAYADYTTARDAAQGATANKNAVLGQAIALARDLAQRIQHDPNTTDQDRADAGLTVPDHTPTPHDADAVLAITPPIVHLDFSIRQQVTIHWGPNPQDERNNGKPAGVMGAEIQYHKGGVPAEEDDWRPLDTDTDSPYVHTITESTPTTYAYRARYIDKKLKHGAHGDPAVCTVTV